MSEKRRGRGREGEGEGEEGSGVEGGEAPFPLPPERGGETLGVTSIAVSSEDKAANLLAVGTAISIKGTVGVPAFLNEEGSLT